MGERREQTLWLEVIKTLLLESFLPASKDNGRCGDSKNLARVHEALVGSEFMNRPVSGYGRRFKRAPSDTFYAVQLVSWSPSSFNEKSGSLLVLRVEQEANH
jgi:hypothetical protein